VVVLLAARGDGVYELARSALEEIDPSALEAAERAMPPHRYARQRDH
jgi:hypothetical protein